MSLTGSCFSSESAPGPFHHGGSKTTNSPHPSSRKGHLSTARWSSKCSPIVFDPLQFSCCCRGLFPGPTELSAVDPDAVHDYGFSNRPVWVKRFSDCPPLQCRCRSRARASLRNRHQGPSIMGVRRRRTHLIHRPARDIFPPLGGAPSVLLSYLILYNFHAAAAACSRVQRNSVPSTQMRCMITASLIGRFGSSAFQTVHHYSVDVAHGLVLLFGIGTRALPSWGFEDDELTSSIVPQGTSFHRSVELQVFSYRI